jgi:hypothetical protein
MKKLAFLFIIVFLGVACPPPYYPVLFGIDGKWRNAIEITEDQISINITGDITPYPWWDYLFITIEIKGLPPSQMDSLNEKIIFESKTFQRCGPRIYLNKNKANAVFNTDYDHKSFREMTSDEFNSYLDSVNAQIKIVDLLSKPYLIEVTIDKELMARKLKKWFRDAEKTKNNSQ